MTTLMMKEHLDNLISCIYFNYNGLACAIDPLSRTRYLVRCGQDVTEMSTVEEVMSVKFFDGKALKDITDDITDVEY